MLADSGFLIALLSQSDQHRKWAVAQVPLLHHPWITCEAVLSEAFHLLGHQGRPQLAELLTRGVVKVEFTLGEHLAPVLNLMNKYAGVPMSFADACLVRMTETLAEPSIVTTDNDFRLYRRHGRQVIPCLIP